MNRITSVWSKLRAPIVLAPLAGGASTPELAAAVSEAGGLGSLGLAYSSPSQIRDLISATRKLTSHPFAVNLFSPQANQPLAGDVAKVTEFISQYHAHFGLPPATLPVRPAEDFNEQLAAIVDAELPPSSRIFSFTFGLMPPDVMATLRAHEFVVIGTATTVEEARLLADSGVDAVIAQGAEAGGHRGTFVGEVANSMIGTMALVPQIVDAVRIPVIASGGIMDGRGIVAALALGATAVQMGTAFLVCPESGAAPVYKERVGRAVATDIVSTRVFSGRWARGLSNNFVREFERTFDQPLSYPWQNALTRDLRRAAAKQQASDFLSLWAGQGAGMARTLPAGELVRRFTAEMQETLEALNQVQLKI